MHLLLKRLLLCPLLVGLILCLGSCSLKPRFSDPEKQARYETYLAQVVAASTRYEDQLFEHSPALRIWGSGDFSRLMQLVDSDLPTKQLAAKAKPIIARLLSHSARSKYVLAQLPGVLLTRFCAALKQDSWLKSNTFEAQQLALNLAVCQQIDSKRYRFNKATEFVALADAFVSLVPKVSEDENLNADAIVQSLTPLLVTKPKSSGAQWADTGQLLARAQLDAWKLTKNVNDVVAPEEFKDLQVNAVQVVLGDYEGKFFGWTDLLSIDLYSAAILQGCDESAVEEPTAELNELCRQLSLKVIRYSTNLRAIDFAFDILAKHSNVVLADIVDGNATRPNFWPDGLAQQYAELQQLKDVELLKDARDLPTLKSRLEVLSTRGTLALARQLHRGHMHLD